MSTILKFKILGDNTSIQSLSIQQQSSMHYLVTATLAAGSSSGSVFLQEPNTAPPTPPTPSNLTFDYSDGKILTFK
jgi:hypothetical protein